MINLTLNNEDATAALGYDLAGLLPRGTVVTLSGAVGAGKTSLARAMVRAFMQDQSLTVTSPTFNMVGRYESRGRLLLHYDLYRIKQAQELDELGFEEIPDAALTIIEWPDRLDHRVLSRAPRLNVTINILDDHRRHISAVWGGPDSGMRSIDTAIVFAAGFGTRMAELVRDVPKPLIPVAGRPVLSYLFEQLATVGVRRLILNTHYLPDKIQDFVEIYRDQFDIQLCHEDILLETGGGLQAALPKIDRDIFYALNGDALQTEGPLLPHLARLALRFDPKKMDILLLLMGLNQPMITPGAGDYFLNNDGQCRLATEKNGTHFFAGPRILRAAVFDGVAPGKFSFLQQMNEAQARGRLYGLPHDGIYHHLSTPQDVSDVTAFLQGKKTPHIMTPVAKAGI